MTAAASDPSPLLSVVIPTYGKGETLEKVIRHLEDQSLPRGEYEVVVVDDGSPDDTAGRMRRVAAATPLDLRYLRQENRGVSAARNRGVREARAPIVVLLQDDILATPDLLTRHLLAHARHPEPTAAVVGRVAWPPDWRLDHFMRWLDDGGPQFRYQEILGRRTIGFRHFYTCNVSLKRETMLENPFDEEIVYGYEDLELACRLQAKGFTFHFEEDALGYHEHRRSFEDFRRRMYASGQSLYYAVRNHPEFAGVIQIRPMSAAKRLRTRARALVLPLARRLGARRTIEKYWRAMLDEEVMRGYTVARERDGAAARSVPLAPAYRR
jgi:glycosyltransferase involved in cell wall biosynthesis